MGRRQEVTIAAHSHISYRWMQGYAAKSGSTVDEHVCQADIRVRLRNNTIQGCKKKQKLPILINFWKKLSDCKHDPLILWDFICVPHCWHSDLWKSLNSFVKQGQESWLEFLDSWCVIRGSDDSEPSWDSRIPVSGPLIFAGLSPLCFRSFLPAQ